ncbi:tyrosinase family oxidase copper chaperone [Streptomyces sp. NPDC093546]|uniref:tyrosinase family oxidase copper chaperone n=1 Tax=Streptomyces sp. NPDC093546 TaxID=3366040 RepID=UPI00382B28F8
MVVMRRRAALRAVFALTVAAVTGAALSRASLSRAPLFDERYKGRRIQGRRMYGDELDVRVDGRRLHLMRCADGGYLSPVDHYRSYPTPLAATRAAVDELGAARLAEGGAAHGVHA